MIPIKQTILHDPANGQYGNCLSAVLASLLHLPIETIPVFSDPERWEPDLNEWLRPYGLAYVPLAVPDGWFSSRNIVGCYHEICGPTLRSADVLHAMVGIDGVPVHDPHPDNTGITKVDSIGVFIALMPWAFAQSNHSAAPTPPEGK